ncbi:unnamed protein product, partial [marine sediment metagenome]
MIYDRLMAINGAAAVGLWQQGRERRELMGTIGAAEFQALLLEAPAETNVSRGAALVAVHGPMVPRASRLEQLFFGAVSTFGLEAEMRALAEDDEVEVIVLDINSPGGDVRGMPELAATVRDVREKKPVIALGNVDALSAAYWLASQATEIVGVQSSRFGSMGAFFKHADFSGALKAEGIVVTEFALGARKLEFSSGGPLDDEAKARINDLLAGIVDGMVDDVAAGRRMPREQVQK